jgi:hypothetical protein
MNLTTIPESSKVTVEVPYLCVLTGQSGRRKRFPRSPKRAVNTALVPDQLNPAAESSQFRAGDHPITSLPSTPPALLCISPSSPNSTPAPFSLSPPKNNNVPHLRLTSSHLSICLYSFGCQSFFSAVPFSVLSPLSLSLVSPLSISGPSFVFFFYSLFS